MFKFSDVEFNIKEAYLDGYISNSSLMWGFEVIAEREAITSNDKLPSYISLNT